MNKDVFQGQWNVLKGKVKEQWGKLTDDDIKEINGKREQLLGKIQKRYGYAKDKAETEINSFVEDLEEELAHQKSHQGVHSSYGQGSDTHSKPQGGSQSKNF